MLNSHSEEKNLSCGKCEYKTNRKGNLNNDNMMHTGEQPFSCHICDYKCKEKYTDSAFIGSFW